jgi:drug/metabolite transporter (DMT)-like permease
MDAGPSRPSRSRLYALLGLMVTLWSANFVFAKLAVRGAPPLLVVCLRTVLSGLFMAPVYAVLRRRGPVGAARPSGLRPVTARDLPRLAALGVLGIVGNQLLFVLALSRTSVAHGAVVGATGPVMVLAGAALAGQERLTTRKLVGLVAAGLGVAVLQVARAPGGEASAAGDLLMLGNAALFAGFTVFGKRAASEYGSLVVNAVAFWAGGLLALPYAVYGLARLGGPAQIGPSAWVGILYMSVAPSIVGYLIYSYALRWMSASRVSSVSYLQPVGATVLGVVFLGEQPGLAYAAGAAVVLAGVWLASRR